MRILKNIYNEYIIYEARIQSTELDDNKLLAIITYKNLFPNDFSELQIGKGFVYNIFENRYNYIKEEQNKIDLIVDEKTKQINEIEKEFLLDIDELDSLYLLTGNIIIQVNGKNDTSFKNRAEFIREMKDNPDKIYYSHYGQATRQQYDFLANYKKLENNSEYQKRKSILEQKAQKGIEKLLKEIEVLKINKKRLESEKITTIINSNKNFFNSQSALNNFKEVKDNFYYPLIEYLITNGYIDETYQDYLTYFYENSITIRDKRFLRSVTDRKKKEFNYSLDNPELIISWLREIDFEREEILNYDLVDYLLNKDHPYLKIILKQIEKEERFDFIVSYIKLGKEYNKFVREINEQWPDLIMNILSKDIDKECKKLYILYSFYNSSDEILVKQNINNCITNYISNDSDFLNIESPNLERLIDCFRELGVKFININIDNSNPLLFLSAYKEDLYKINMEMLTIILEKVYGIPKNDDFKHKNYTLIISKPEESLVAYVRNNISLYMEEVFKNCGSSITDDETAAIEILNNPNITDNLKITYIDYLNTIIERIELVTQLNLWEALLMLNKVKYSESNIMNYYLNQTNFQEFDEALINFINEGDGDLKFNRKDLDKKANQFHLAILKCNDLDDNRYQMLLRNNNWYYYPNFNIDNLSETKIKFLIQKEIIRMNETTLLFVREHYKTSLLYFITVNIKGYVNNIINKNNFAYDEMISVLESKVPVKSKIKLLGYTSEPISIKIKNILKLL